MHCRACDCELTDEEAVRKYDNWKEIENPEERYIDLCNRCIGKSDLAVYDSDMLDTTSIPEEDYHGEE